jgi:hypothetical protein
MTRHTSASCNPLLQVLRHLRARGGPSLRLEAVMHAEGSPNISAVVDLNRSYSDFGRSAVGETRSLGARTTTEALTDTCASHVLITSKSGFSHLIALFCPSTVVVAVPDWISYAFLRNVLLVAEQAPPSVDINVSGTVLTFPLYSIDPRAFDAILRSFSVI